MGEDGEEDDGMGGRIQNGVGGGGVISPYPFGIGPDQQMQQFGQGVGSQGYLPGQVQAQGQQGYAHAPSVPVGGILGAAGLGAGAGAASAYANEKGHRRLESAGGSATISDGGRSSSPTTTSGGGAYGGYVTPSVSGTGYPHSAQPYGLAPGSTTNMLGGAAPMGMAGGRAMTATSSGSEYSSPSAPASGPMRVVGGAGTGRSVKDLEAFGRVVNNPDDPHSGVVQSQLRAEEMFGLHGAGSQPIVHRDGGRVKKS